MSTERKSNAQLQEFAKKMVAGCSIRESMISAGYSEKQANKGKRAINKRMLKAMAAEGYKLADLARQFSIKDLGDIAIGRLVTNAMIGKDGGALSAKALGSHKDLNLFQSDAVTGMIVLQMPQHLQVMTEQERAELLAQPKE